MRVTTKEYLVHNFVEYVEGPVGDVTGLAVEEVSTVLATHSVTITTWLDSNGSGFERRESKHV